MYVTLVCTPYTVQKNIYTSRRKLYSIYILYKFSINNDNISLNLTLFPKPGCTYFQIF